MCCHILHVRTIPTLESTDSMIHNSLRYMSGWTASTLWMRISWYSSRTLSLVTSLLISPVASNFCQMLCSATGILVLKILVPRTEIFGGKMVPQDPFFGKNGPCLEIWSESCKLERQSVIHLIHVRKSFPCLLLLQVHTSLFPSGAFFWVVAKFSPGQR